MSTLELDNRNIAISMRKSVENLVISSQDAIGQSISQALTFSGVITQHANQILQDNKNASRSPSPSQRNSDADPMLDLEKSASASEMAIHVPSHPAGDTVSVASADFALAAQTKYEGKTGSAGAGTGPRVKKKSWYSGLYPTYKSRSDDFKRLFKDLPDDERLIVDYSCAIQKDILMHGRLYASQNYLCFYASIFGWETSMTLRWKDVTAITKEKTALVIPNAILVCTEGEKNFLTSFSGRDKAYLMLFRVWQNALMDQPRSSQEIWQWVHSCYGEELGFNSDDEGYARDLLPPAHDSLSEDLVDSSSMEAGGERGERGGSQGRDTPPRGAVAGAGAGSGAGEALPTDLSDTTDSENDKPHNNGGADKCTSPHGGKLILHQQFPINIDQLFTMIFTNSKFNLELLAARRTTDYEHAPWQPANGLECRQVKYTLGLASGPLGPKEVHVTETQVMNKCSQPGALYSIDASSENAGIPYADYFTVEAHYCLQRIAEHITDLSFYGHVKYKKNMLSLVKAFLEKNAISGLEEYGRLLETRLALELEGQAPARKTRRHRRLTASAAPPHAEAALPRAPPPPPPARPRWLLLALILLLALNAALYWRLHTHAGYSHRAFSAAEAGAGAGAGADPHAEVSGWSEALERHSERRRGELKAWRHAIEATVAHLTQTEQALRKLLETIKPTLDKAQRDADASEASEDQASDDQRASEPSEPDPVTTMPRDDL